MVCRSWAAGYYYGSRQYLTSRRCKRPGDGRGGHARLSDVVAAPHVARDAEWKYLWFTDEDNRRAKCGKPLYSESYDYGSITR